MKDQGLAWLTDNLSYKIVAVLISLILWVTVLGKRDFAFTKNLELEWKLADGMVVTAQTADKVKVRVMGQRNLIKRYVEDNSLNHLELDISDKKPGVYEFEISSNLIPLPKGLRVMSVKPNLVRVEVVEKKGP